MDEVVIPTLAGLGTDLVGYDRIDVENA